MAKAVKHHPGLFSVLFSKSGRNRNGLKPQHVKHALSHFVALAGSCSAVVSLPKCESGLKDLLTFAGMAGENFTAWEGGKGLSLAASSWLLRGIVHLCSRDAVAAQEFELQHVGVWDGGHVSELLCGQLWATAALAVHAEPLKGEACSPMLATILRKPVLSSRTLLWLWFLPIPSQIGTHPYSWSFPYTLSLPNRSLALQPKILILCAALHLVIYLPISHASCKGSWNERVWGCAAPGSVVCVYFSCGFMLKVRNSLASANIKCGSTWLIFYIYKKCSFNLFPSMCCVSVHPLKLRIDHRIMRKN